MVIRRWIGISLQIGGALLLLNAGQRITGFVVAESVSVSLSGFLGLVLLLGGIGLTMWHHQAYDSYEPAVRRAMGASRYEPLPESDQRATLKAYRRHENKLEKTAHYQARQAAKQAPLPAPYELIRTERFEKAIKRHDPAKIARALEKLTAQGARNLDRMHVGPLKGLSRIKVDATARIIYHEKPGNKIELLDYTSDHDYGESARKLRR